MKIFLRVVLALALAIGIAPAAAYAAPRTVCTITVNSPDEKETFRKRLPAGQYQFVELVETGRPDWLRSACAKDLRCDVLVVSGHFNAGETFYSDRVESTDHLSIDELERAACSQSCPGLFAQLKEVHLYGCESLNPDARKYASAYGESGRARMRRVFAGVPVIYGFSAAAPVGATAAALLHRAFDAGAAGEIATGRPSARLLAAFSRSAMATTSGLRPGDAQFATRGRICSFYDERLPAARKLALVHAMMKRDMIEATASFARIEHLFATLDDSQRQAPDWTQGLAEISTDEASRDRFLALARAAPQPELRARMLAFAHTVAWLPPAELRAENIFLIDDLLARQVVAYPEVDLVCSLNRDGGFDTASLHQPLAPPGRVGHAALLACLDDEPARARVLAALGSRDERDVHVARAYLRHRPMTERAELLAVTNGITSMTDPRSQIRALDALGLLALADRESLESLAAEFKETRSLGVQRALAEVFMRSDLREMPRPQLMAALRDHRLPSPDGRSDLIDTLIQRLQ